MKMNHSIDVSFIVPVYNTECYLARCIESILAESVSKEIILIDDGSTDNSLSIALEYAKRYDFITVIHRQNSGASTSRNQGILLAKGEFIYFVDSDDYIQGNYFAKLVQIANHYQADLIKVGATQIFPEKTVYIQPILTGVTGDNGQLTHCEAFFNALASKAWRPGICWTLIRRQFLTQLGLYFLPQNSVEDQLFYAQLLTLSPYTKIIEFDWNIYQYYRHSKSVTNTMTTKFILDHFIIAQKLQDYYVAHTFSVETKHNFERIIAILYRNALSAYFCLPEEERPNVKEKFNPPVIEILENWFDDLGYALSLV